MYAIVTKVVTPASTSVRQLVPSRSNSKYRSRRCREVGEFTVKAL
jgi:hypothetical protein